MKLSQQVPISASTFYRFLLESLREDYKAANKAPVKDSDLKHGLSFQKRFGKKQESAMEVRVVDLIENERYALAFQSSRGTQWVTYDLTAIEENACQVTYTEDYSPKGKLNAWNYKLLFPLMRKSLERRMRLQIEKIAEFAKNKEDLHHE
ncbi:hypothetical protein ABID29_000185 [Streptococcus rupicaprae]|uniref:DUF3284 domain-containing protein n=1 Tax=Streptococcus rupicaprae TaxID=759619 RepID=A0ABV2FEW1_9STRE